MVDEARGCPCLHTTPCGPQCTCVRPFMSAGCRHCCSYGSPEQQKAAAEHIAAAVALYDARSRTTADGPIDDPEMAVPTAMQKYPELQLHYVLSAEEPEPEFIRGPCPIHGIDCRSNPPWDGTSCGDLRGWVR